MAMGAADRVRPKLGDVVEISTPCGLAYFHYTHKHPVYGALIRVLPGLFEQRPQDFLSLVDDPPQFITFFPLGAACSRGIARIVANTAIPKISSDFPTFRTGVADVSGAIQTWWLWDGTEWKIGSLTTEVSYLPIRAVITDTVLVERIVSGWRHEFAT